MNSLNRMGLKFWKTLLAFIGVFMGFSTTVVAQYGVIETNYLYQGKLISEECGTPIPDAEMKLKVKQYYSKDLQEVTLTRTSENGDFILNDYYLNRYDTLYIEVSDKDGPLNGLYKDTIFVIDGSMITYKSNGQGHWAREFINDPPFELALKADGIPPCVEDPDLSILSESDTICYDQAPPWISDIRIEPIAIKEEPLVDPKDDQANMETTGIKDLAVEAERMNVHPNPNTGRFQIYMESREDCPVTLRLFDMKMNLVLQREVWIYSGSNNEFVDISSEASGTYLLIIEGTGFRHSVRVVKAQE